MDLLKLQEWLRSRNYGFPISLLLLPDNPDNAISFGVEEGIGSKGTVTNLTLNFYIRSDHPSACIAIGTKINQDLDMKTRVFIDNTQIILLQANNAVPLLLGIDENGRHIYHVQFKMLVSPTDKLNIRD